MSLLTTLLESSGASTNGLLDFRGSYDASVNTFPATGGSGASSAILKGDFWLVSVAGTLGGSAVSIGDTIFARVDTPGQTAGNWAVLEGNIGYTPENAANKSTDGTFASNSDTLYPSQKAAKTYADAKVSDAINDAVTTIAPSQNAVFDALALKAPLASPNFAGTITSAGAINAAASVTVASSSTVDLGAQTSNNVNISGTTTITSFGTANAGITRNCRATGAFKITYNATTLITKNGKDIVTKADDTFKMLSLGSGNWIMTSFGAADGRIMANAVNNQTGTTYTFAITDLGNDVVANNSAASTYTVPQTSNVAFPIGSKIKLQNKGVGAVTLVKEGSETLLGNALLNQNAIAFIEKTSSTEWTVFGGTAVVTEVINGAAVGTIVNQAYDISVRMPFGGTIMGIATKSTTTAVAGTYTVAISGTSVTGLTTVANGASGVRTNTAATAANTFVAGDYITITLAGATITDLFWSLEYTRAY